MLMAGHTSPLTLSHPRAQFCHTKKEDDKPELAMHIENMIFLGEKGGKRVHGKV
jgi:hypothetical protein